MNLSVYLYLFKKNSTLLKSVFSLVTSSEAQGQIVRARESLNGQKNMARRKVKNGEKSPWGQMSYQISSKRSPPFWLLIGAKNFCVFLPNQKPEREKINKQINTNKQSKIRIFV